MKTILNYRKKFIIPLIIAFCSTMAFISCSKQGNDDNTPPLTYGTFGNASGSQQNPPVSTTGSASLTGSYNSNTNVWEYSISWTSLSSAATIIEIHGPATAGVNGNLVFAVAISGGGTNGAQSTTVTLTEEQEADLLAAKYYYTILNAAYPAGEVRGQITAVTR